MPSIVGGMLTRGVQIVNPANGKAAGAVGLFDTGSSLVLVDPMVISTIGAVPNGTEPIQGVGGGPESGYLYRLDIDMGTSGTVSAVRCVSIPIAASLGVGVLAGADLLDRGVLVRDGPGGFWSFTAAQGAVVPATPSPWLIGGGLVGLAGLAVVALAMRPRWRR